MPYGGNLHIDKLLTNVSCQYHNAAYVADQVFPILPVAKESDKIAVYNIDFRVPDTIRANKTPAKMYSYSVSNSSYVLDEHALADVVTKRDRDNADQPFDLDADTTAVLTDKIQLRREIDTANLCFTTGTWGGYTTCVSTNSWRYNTTTSGNPVVNGNSATSYIQANAGLRPNRVVMGFSTYNLLKDNVNILDRVKYSERAIVTRDMLAALWDVQSVLVGDALYAQGAEGLTQSQTGIWANNALFLYAAPSPGLRQVSAGYMLTLNGRTQPFRTKKWAVEELDGDKIEVSSMFVPKAVMTAAAYLWNATDL